MARDYLNAIAISVSLKRMFYITRCQEEFNRKYSSETFELIMLCKSYLRILNDNTLKTIKHNDSGNLFDFPAETRVLNSDIRRTHTIFMTMKMTDILVAEEEYLRE